MINEDEINGIINNTLANMHNNIHNDIYLSDKQVSLLESYNIDYKSFDSMNSLIFYLENNIDDEELDILLDELVEFNYYHNTNK